MEEKENELTQAENTEQEGSTELTPGKKKGVFSKALGGVGNLLGKGIDALGNSVIEAGERKELIKQFKTKCIGYSFYNASVLRSSLGINLFEAVTDIENKKLIFLENEKIKIGDVLHNKKTNAILEIDDVSPNAFDYEVEGGRTLKCRYAIYKKPETPKAEKPVSITYNTTANSSNTITNSQISGDVTQVNDVSTQLHQLGERLNSVKGKDAKEAIKLYGNFKNCVLNRTKDEGLFAKFRRAVAFSSDLSGLVVSILTMAGLG